MEESIWESPDGRIKKRIIHKGTWGLKPTENCECNIKISNCGEYDSLSYYVIGDSSSLFECLLDDCLLTMFNGEIAEITFRLNEDVTFILELISFKSNGLIYEWDANKKYDIASAHKEKGNKLFQESLHIEASRRFGKGIKILCSIPVEVDDPPEEVGGVKVADIRKLKTKLYNNLASCYLKHCDYETVLEVCRKVLENDSSNVKALYKQAAAQYETHAYEESQKSLYELLSHDPDNLIAAKKLETVNVKVAESNARVNAMFKNMFKK